MSSSIPSPGGVGTCWVNPSSFCNRDAPPLSVVSTTSLPLTLGFDFFFRGTVGVAMARKVQMKTILPDEFVYKTHRDFFHTCRLIRPGLGHT